MTPSAVQKSSRVAPPRRAAAPARPVVSAAGRPAPNYATREETMKVVNRIMDERAELFRRLADA